MHVLAISNQKGGTAKTTTAVCLSAALAEQGKRVLLIDVDAQANATRWLTGTVPGNPAASTIFTKGEELNNLIHQVETGLDLVPATRHLVGLEKALASDPAPQFILQRAVQKLTDDAGATYDFCLVDCPGALGTVTVNALTASHGVLVPVPAQTLSLDGLAALMETVRTVQDRLNDQLRIAGILACRVDRRTRLSSEIIEALEERFPQELLETQIRENIRLAEAPSFGKPITSYDSSSRGAEDFRALAAELTRRLLHETPKPHGR